MVRRGFEVSLTGLNPPHLCAYLTPGPVLPTPYVMFSIN